MKETGNSTGLVNTLLNWFEKEGRDLPWRKTIDPYHILVSEMMLQQTQVQRVLVFYDRWLRQFPDWKTLANATNAEVILAWQGLGYNRRALALRDIAKHIVEYGVPQTEEEWLKLKGIGPYTAGALTVFSLRIVAAPIDTNIRRVLARMAFGIPYPDPKNDKQLMDYMKSSLMNHSEFYNIPQAIFDLANSYCTKTPTCDSCPMKNYCLASKAFLAQTVETPKRMTKKVNERKHNGKPFPDRIYRGRILKLVSDSDGIHMDDIGQMIDETFVTENDDIWVKNMISRLMKDEFIYEKNHHLFLKQ